MTEIHSGISRSAPADVDTVARERRAELGKRAKRFRILIVGRANAGKTTILKKICETTEEPEIYNVRGKKLDTSNIKPTELRGIHNIENEMIFRSNPGFIFHDSCGFEAGGADELERVKAFVHERSKKTRLMDQVHVIWYCIPMNECRPITNAEVQFFSKSGTGKVPVVTVFTKCEALKFKAIEVLEDKEGLSYAEARAKADEYAREHFWNAHMCLEGYKYKPKGHVYLQELNKPDTNCEQLVECTAAVLDGNQLQTIFISTQQNSLELPIKYSTRVIIQMTLNIKDKTWDTQQGQEIYMLTMLKRIMGYFPYWVSENFVSGYWW